MKKNSFVSLLMVTTLVLLASGCGSKNKKGEDLAGTSQGQGKGGKPGTPDASAEQWLKNFCDAKRDQGGIYYGAPDYQCKFFPDIYAPSDADLQTVKTPRIVFSFSFQDKGIIHVGGSRQTGRALLIDASNNHVLFELNENGSNLGTLTAGKYALWVTPGTSGLAFFTQSCMDINQNLTECRFK